MASRKERKEQARAARVAAEAAATATAARRQRLRVFAGVVLIAAIVIAVAITVSSGDGSSGRAPKTQAAQVQRLLAGIPQSGVRLGNPRAPVTVNYVGDLECPYCRAFTLGVLPQFIARYVRTGKVDLVYRSLCTATCHFNSSRFVPQQVAAYAAGEQRLFWQYAELFYRAQQDESLPYVTEGFLRGLAKAIPSLDFKKWLLDRRNPALMSQVQADQAFVTRARLPEQTPEILMTGPRGSAHLPADGLPTAAWMASAVKAVS